MLTHVYITSLGHSGSTILGIALGAIEGGISIGEVDATMRRIEGPQHDCTCGSTAQDCPVWGAVFSAWESAAAPGATGVPTASERYRWGYDRLYSVLLGAATRDSAVMASTPLASTPPASTPPDGTSRFLVDTSKDLEALKAVPVVPGVELKVVFLVKDPRSYFVSHYRKWIAGAHRSRREGESRARPRKRRAPLFALEIGAALINWWWGNRRILRTLRGGQYQFLVINYEELVLNTAEVEHRLETFLGAPVSLGEIPHRPDQRHILRGNALRHNPERSSSLRYDYRWFYDPWVRRLGLLFSPLLRWGVRNGLLPDQG